MKMRSATFHFYGNLNDFLPTPLQNVAQTCPFSGTPAVKDAIEALGIPHVEVDVILVNGQSVGFDYLLRNRDEVRVYPSGSGFDYPSGVTHLIPPFPSPPAFILDVHLGKLAKAMRMLGFDTKYRNDYSDPEIVYRALQEKRIILTRDVGILKTGAVRHGYWIRSTQPDRQLEEVVQRFGLIEQIRPFQRCMTCNARIRRVNKAEVLEELPPKTRRYFDEIYRCDGCQKLYWKGSHYQKMLQTIAQIRAPRSADLP